MTSAPLLSDPQNGNDEVSIDIAQGRYKPKEPIWQRSGILNGRSVLLISKRHELLKEKVRAQYFLQQSQSIYTFTRKTWLFVLTSSFGLMTALPGSLMMATDTDETHATAGASLLGIGTVLLSGSALFYARHVFLRSQTKYSLWVKKKKMLGVFKRCINEKDRTDLLSPSDFRDLMLKEGLPKSLKEKIAARASLSQFLAVANHLSEDQIKTHLYPYMHSIDQDFLNFLLNPADYSFAAIQRGLKQFSGFFANHPQILVAFLERLHQEQKDRTEIRECLLAITALREDTQGVVWDEYTQQIESLIADKIKVFVGDESIVVSRRKLSRYPRLAIYFKEREYMKEDADAADYIASAKNTSDGAELQLPLLPDQEPVHQLSLLRYIETGRLPESGDMFALLMVADYYGVEEQVDACLPRILDEMPYGLDEKAETFKKLIHVCSLPNIIIEAIQKEYLYEANLQNIENVRFWLTFAKEVSPHQLFHRFSDIPTDLSPQYVELICEMRPRKLIQGIFTGLSDECKFSRDPIELLQRYSKIDEVVIFLEDLMLEHRSQDCVVSLWDFASRNSKAALKTKVAARLKKEPLLAQQWPLGEFPDELTGTSL